MTERIINRHRGLLPSQHSSRYRRLRYADFDDDTGRDDRDWDWDGDCAGRRGPDYALPELFDLMWGMLCCLSTAEPFNPLPLFRSSSRPRFIEAGVSRGGRPLEERLAEHLCQLPEHPAQTWLFGSGPELASLYELANRDCDEPAPILAALLFSPFWIRSPISWAPPADTSSAAIVRSLVDHLFVDYPVPAFLYNAWFLPPAQMEERWLAWFVLLGQGGSLRRLTSSLHDALERAGLLHHGRLVWGASEGLSRRSWAPLSKKLGASLWELEADLSPSEGLMHAEVLRLGGSTIEVQRLHEDPTYAVVPGSLACEPEERTFWQDTVRWLARHRDQLDDAQCGLVLEWARHRHCERRVLPFSWSGRTPPNALREAERYQQSLLDQPHRSLSWSPQGWGYRCTMAGHTWSFEELINSRALLEETVALSHCVRFYDLSCSEGSSAIIGLRRDDCPRLTIEVHPPTGEVVQIRGSHNRLADPDEMKVVEQWIAEVLEP